MDHDDAGLTLLIFNVWYAYIHKGHHKAKRAGCIAGDKRATGCKKRATECCTLLFTSSWSTGINFDCVSSAYICLSSQINSFGHVRMVLLVLCGLPQVT